MKASFSILQRDDTQVVLVDNDQGRSITNDAERVISIVDEMLDGLGQRRVYYRDTQGRFDELLHNNGRFMGFCPCSGNQQIFFTKQVNVSPGDA